MRVLHVLSRANVGGTSRWVRELLARDAASRIDSMLVMGSVQDGEVEADISGWPIMRIPELGRSISPASDLAALRSLRSLTLDFKPDLINTHTSKAGLLGRTAARSLGSGWPAIVHTAHGLVLRGYYSAPVSAGIAAVERVLGTQSDLIIAVGSSVRRDLISARIAPADKVVTVLPGIADEGVRGRVSAGPVTAGWLARAVKIKRPDRLLGAARRTPYVIYLVGGDGPLRNGLEARAPANVQTLGWVEPNDFWSRCDMAVLTSDNEGVPTALVEAALAGIPAVATNAGSVSDAVLHGDTGLVVEKSAGAVAEAVRCLADDHAARHRMGVAARERALVEFSPERMWEQHQRAYELALENRWRRTRRR